MADYYKHDDFTKFQTLPVYLTGPAHEWYNIEKTYSLSWSQIHPEFLARFESKIALTELINQITTIKRKEKKTLEEYL